MSCQHLSKMCSDTGNSQRKQKSPWVDCLDIFERGQQVISGFGAKPLQANQRLAIKLEQVGQ